MKKWLIWVIILLAIIILPTFTIEDSFTTLLMLKIFGLRIYLILVALIIVILYLIFGRGWIKKVGGRVTEIFRMKKITRNILIGIGILIAVIIIAKYARLFGLYPLSGNFYTCGVYNLQPDKTLKFQFLNYFQRETPATPGWYCAQVSEYRGDWGACGFLQCGAVPMPRWSQGDVDEATCKAAGLTWIYPWYDCKGQERGLCFYFPINSGHPGQEIDLNKYAFTITGNTKFTDAYIENDEICMYLAPENVGSVPDTNIYDDRSTIDVTLSIDLTKLRCIPSWTCGEWSSCINGQQSRLCNDGCGNTRTEQKVCEICSPSWTCGSWGDCIENKQTRSCADGCGNTRTEEQSCGIPPECVSGQKQNYTCPDGTQVDWKYCDRGVWREIISPKNQCPEKPPVINALVYLLIGAGIIVIILLIWLIWRKK